MKASARPSVRIKRVGDAPTVAARAWLRGGTRLEEIPGQALITGRMLSEGTRRRSHQRIALEAENRGMMLESFGTHETIGVAIDALAEDWELALEWLAELVFEPSFPPERMSWLARQAAGELDSLFDQPENRAGHAFLQEIYQSHPYARPVQGDRQSLSGLDASDCATFHRRSLHWGGLVVVAGQIDPGAVTGRVDELFGDLAGATMVPGVAPPPPRRPCRRILDLGRTESSDHGQAHLFLGHLTIPLRHEDHAGLDALAVILGAGTGLGGRLPERVREREGLAYHVDVATTAGAGLDAGRLAVYVGTSPANLERAEKVIQEELQRLLDQGVQRVELEEAKAHLLGREPFRRETARQWADLLAESAFYDIEVDRPDWLAERLAALEKSTVDILVERHIEPGALSVVSGLPGRDTAP